MYTEHFIKLKSRKSSYIPSILVVGNGLSGGGAEARLSRLVPRLFGGQVDLALLLGGNNNTLQEKNGKVFDLQWRGKFSYPRLILSLRRIVLQRQYDAIISFGFFPIVISALAILGISDRPKFIISEITRPIASVKMLNGPRRFIYYWLRKYLYKKGDLISANSIDGLFETCQLIGIDPKFGVRLPNIINSEEIRMKKDKVTPFLIPISRYVICISRLAYMKRIDTVVEAIKKLVGRVDCGLVIVGDGEAQQALETQVKSLGLQSLVMFTGKLDNPFPLLKGPLAFVLASEYEGFSNSILEAMFCDVPVITSLCSSDAREMCEQGAALGFDVGDVEQLAEHIVAVMSDETLAQGLVNRAREYRAPHALENAIPVYENLIRRVAGYEEFSG